jgi:hypothetical protein
MVEKQTKTITINQLTVGRDAFVNMLTASLQESDNTPE